MAISPNTCVRATRLPSAVAVSAPILRLFSARPSSSAITAPVSTTGAMALSVVRVRISSEPACQKRSWSYTTGFKSAMPPESPSSTAASATPASVRRTGLSCPPPALPVNATTSVAASAPHSASARICSGSLTPHSAAPSTMAKLAPEFTPNRPGSASGLRVSVCISAPASPSDSPATMPARVRGRRASSTIVQSASWQVPVSASNTREKGRDLAPTSRLRATINSSNNERDPRTTTLEERREADITHILESIMIVIITLGWLC